MKSETKRITDVFADMVRQSYPELNARLEDQAEALREIACTEPIIGRWVDANDVSYLLSTFALGGKDFAAKFPTMAHITEQQRQRLVATIEAHMEQCKHCSLKRGYDLELDARIEQAYQQNSDQLLRLLEEDGGDGATEVDHKIKTAYSAHQ